MLQFKLVPEGSDHRQTKLSVSAEMKWSSNPYMKSMIRNGAKSGLTSTYALFLDTLKPFCADKKRRHGKGAAAKGEACKCSRWRHGLEPGLLMVVIDVSCNPRREWWAGGHWERGYGGGCRVGCISGMYDLP